MPGAAGLISVAHASVALVANYDERVPIDDFIR
jgi:hypothetical protein